MGNHKSGRKPKPPKYTRCPTCGGMVKPVKVETRTNKTRVVACLACETARKVLARPDCSLVVDLEPEHESGRVEMYAKVFSEGRPTADKAGWSELGRMVDTATRPLG